ncbi:MAG: flippase-like domain-containing protein [Elusimicrobia bacterium]|nr:flippase-like domain-containing protein [Elusimicrobiota bacterium]
MSDLRQTALRVLAGRRIPHRRLILGAGILGSLAILAYLSLGHIGALQQVSARIDWFWVPAAAACAVLGYLSTGLALAELLKLLGYRLPWVELMGIGLVSTTANYLVSSAGASGFALKAHLLHRRGVPYGITVTASVLSSAILYFVLAVLIGQGLVYLALNLRGTRIAVMEGALGLLLLLAATLPILAVFLSRRLRGNLTRRLFHWANRLVFCFSKSEIPREDFEEFELQLAQGLERVRGNKSRLTRTIAYTCVDWGLAMIAALLYRVCYYLVPALLSVPSLWLLKISEPGAADQEGPAPTLEAPILEPSPQ